MRASGFSLIELLIVISIVAIINAIIMPNFSSIQNGAKQISAKSTARSVMIAIEQYYFLNNDYPPGVNVSIKSVIGELNSVGLLSSDPTNPYTGQPYTSSDNSGRVLYNKLSAGGYTLVGYGKDNQAVIFEY